MAESTDGKNREIIKEVVQRFVDAQLQGEKPNIDEFVKKYPDLENQIRDSIKDVQKIDDLFDSLVQADESDFENTVITQDFISQKLGDFEIVEMIGHGGMGVVYLAHDTKLERSVAIKSLPAELADDSTARMRFRREAKLLASLNHPNIAVIHDIIEEEKTGYLILEYVPGETLAQRIADKPLKLKEVLSISRQIAEGVSAAHKKGVIHRDLKPANIKITPEARVKVLDFGLAKEWLDESKSNQITATEPGRVLGTPAYMSPEQARGKSTDKRTDIWSFGCIMYEMLTGHLPFKGETATDTLAQIIEREPDWVLLPKDTPANIRTLLRRCLEKDQNQRLQNIGDAAIEIGETLTLSATAKSLHATAKLQRLAVTIVVFVIILLGTMAVLFNLNRPSGQPPKLIRLAVLPFENLGPNGNEYLAAGVTDAITARLAGISDLGIISRQTAIRYKDSTKTIQQIGKDLLVDYILNGTVQYEHPSDPNSPVRIAPQLIKVSDDTHVWAQSFNYDWDGMFRVLSDVAEQVATAMDKDLIGLGRKPLPKNPTQNKEAYDLYQRGKEDFYYMDIRDYHIRNIIELFERAVDLDPDFALAWAWLSKSYTSAYWRGVDQTEDCLTKAERAVREALRVDSDLPEAHQALGQYYYHGRLNYESAREEFETVLRLRPNDAEALCLLGCVQRRLGDFETALENIGKASQLDPRPLTLGDLCETAVYMREYDRAERACNRNISLYPDSRLLRAHKALLYLRGRGDVVEARKIVEEAVNEIKNTDPNVFARVLTEVEIYAGNFSEALHWQERSPYPNLSTQHHFIPKALQIALIHDYRRDKESAKKYYEEAKDILNRKIDEDAHDARFHSALGIAYAGLGEEDKAIMSGDLATKLLPEEKDAMRGRARLVSLAQIFVIVGQYDEASKQVEHLLSVPSELSPNMLKYDPIWNPLRRYNPSHFNELLEKAEQTHPK